MGIDGLEEAVAADILARMKRVSRRLYELGIPHALIGGLAVGVHGHPRATKDVDFLVGEEAFEGGIVLSFREELHELVELAVTDLLGVPPRRPVLNDELRLLDGVPVVSLDALIMMKLDANRPQDVADVTTLLRLHPGRHRSLLEYMQANASDLLPRLLELLATLPS